MGVNKCDYTCIGGEFVFTEGTPDPGYYCPAFAGECDIVGQTISIPASLIPDDPSAALALNSGEYVYHGSLKKLLFRSGKSGKGKCFKAELTVKELSKLDPDAAELVKSLNKNKRVANFSVIVKAQKMA
jgi:hypothetical protein